MEDIHELHDPESNELGSKRRGREGDCGDPSTVFQQRKVIPRRSRVHHTPVAELREELMDHFEEVERVTDAIFKQNTAAAPSSRAAYLRSLDELIGPPPADRSWEDEWIKLGAESLRLNGSVPRGTLSLEEYVEQHDSITQNRETTLKPAIDNLIN